VREQDLRTAFWKKRKSNKFREDAVLPRPAEVSWPLGSHWWRGILRRRGQARSCCGHRDPDRRRVA